MIMPEPGFAQVFSLDLNNGENQLGGSAAARIIQLVILITVLSIAPSILIMMTSFVRIIIVFSLLRTAMGTQQTPPNFVLISLALFLTFFVMQPTMERVYDQGIAPLIAEQITEQQAFERSILPVRDFMLANLREADLLFFANIAKIDDETATSAQDAPMRIIVPAFMIGEIRRAFEIGFLVFIPFLIIDLVVASVLMSMGMMMLPPVIISLPFKLIFFVLVDGWYMVAGSLVQSFDSGLP
ncbi:MAG: flagellar type III secretion system pore protein FliP [Pseudomonadota bacterium]